MKKKVGWLVVTCLMVAALLLASCAPAVTEEEEKVAPPVKEEKVAPPKEKEEVVVPEKKVEMVKWTGTKADGTVVEKMIEKPRYGGVIALTQDVKAGAAFYYDTSFVASQPWLTIPNQIMEFLLVGDWKRGPAGTGELSFWGSAWIPAEAYMTGVLAESWERPDPDTIVFHIRKGVHWQDKPPLNGREFTADDAAFVFNRAWSPVTRTYPELSYPRAQNIKSIEATDKYTLVIKTLPGRMGTVDLSWGNIPMYAAEVVPKDGSPMDKRAMIGTGAFMLQDVVESSSATLVRNPNYWRKHPLYPEDTMPYLDNIKFLIIPDASTRMSALRTHKLDILKDLSWDDARGLMKTNPELKYGEHLSSSELAIAMRLDKPELPTSDIRVRQALSMAINRQAIVDLFYGGKATILNWPASRVPEQASYFEPLKKAREAEFGELWSYNPEKAKQLLAEAGYPSGFRAEIVTRVGDVDLISIVKEDWAKIGVEMEIAVKEAAVFTTLWTKKTYSEMMMDSVSAYVAPHRFLNVRAGGKNNTSVVNDPLFGEYEAKVSATFPNTAERDRLMNEILPYMQRQLYYIQLVTPGEFTFWQPWVKGYQGENTEVYSSASDIERYIWIDQDLKQQMTGTR